MPNLSIQELKAVKRFWDHLACAQLSSRGRIEKRLDRYLKRFAAVDIECFAEDFATLKRSTNVVPILEAALIIGCGDSEDGFTDFRSWLVLQGKNEFTQILADPDFLGLYQPDAIPIEEWYSEYYPSDVYKSVTEGRELPWFDHGPYPDFYESIDVASLSSRYPKLWNRIESTHQIRMADGDAARHFILESKLNSISTNSENVLLLFTTGARIEIANVRQQFEAKYKAPADSPDHPLLNQQVFAINTDYYPDSFYIWFANRKKVSFGFDEGAYSNFDVTLPRLDG